MRCAAENAAIGAVDVIHGSDFPLMVANQLKLSFSLAAAYGESPSARYALDAALVCACGIGWRAFVRRVSDVIPFGSWMVRATFGFAGTMATGLLLEARHDGTLKKTIEKSHIGLRRFFPLTTQVMACIMDSRCINSSNEGFPHVRNRFDWWQAV